MQAAVKTELTVGELANRSGVKVSTLHYYEEIGLIPAFRTGGNQRRYPRGVLRRVAVIRVAQRLGLSLSEIKSAFASLPANRAPSPADWSKLSRSWKEELEKRILALQQLKDQLNTCIGCGCLSMSECPLRNPRDRAGSEGAGAIFLD